jgi:hypothetical protein
MVEQQTFNLWVVSSSLTGVTERMEMILQSLSGLTDDDPIHRYLGIADKFLEDHNWAETVNIITSEELFTLFFRCLGHPVTHAIVEDYKFDNLEESLKQLNEPVIAEIVNKLKRRKFDEGMENKGVRILLMWIFANLGLLKERYLESGNGKKFRELNAPWYPSADR